MKKDEVEVQGVTRRELRALVFWAASGVQMYENGSYGYVDDVILKYRRHLAMMDRSTKPEWGIRRTDFDFNQFKGVTEKAIETTYEAAAKIAELFANDTSPSATIIAAAIRAAKIKPQPHED